MIKNLQFKFTLYNNISRIAQWMLITDDKRSKIAYMAFWEVQLQETQVFYIIKVYAFQVRCVDRKSALYCFMKNIRNLGTGDRITGKILFNLWIESPSGTEEDSVKTGQILLTREEVI